MGRHKDLLLMWFIGLYFSAECQQQNLRCICLCSCIKVFITDAAQGFLCITKHLQTKAHMSKSSRGTMEGWLQRWLWGVSFGLCCSREAMANSRTQNLVQNRQKYSKSHEMKQRQDRPGQKKEWAVKAGINNGVQQREVDKPVPRQLYWMLQRRIWDDLDSVCEDTRARHALRATL